jgi:hypothetical protein
MRKQTLVVSVLYVLVLFRNSVVTAQDPWRPSAYPGSNYPAANVQRGGLFRLPMPQQWSGGRPSRVSRPYGPQDNYGIATGGCVNGQRGPVNSSGNCPDGRCGTVACPGGVCPTGADLSYTSSRCVGGGCQTGNCVNGNCAPDPRLSSRCPGGICPPSQMGGWSPRTTRQPTADPFRSLRSVADDNQWMPSRRSSSRPLTDAVRPTDYRRDQWDLQSDDFRPARGSSEWDVRNDRMDRSQGGFDDRSLSRPASNRSIEAPAEAHSGVARI